MAFSRDQDIRINDRLSIPTSELTFRFSRSGGPGGQSVNRTATRVELLFDVAQSSSLSAAERQLILKRLASYVDRDGVLHLFSQTTRSQHRNRQDVCSRFRALLRKSLHVRPRRIPTKPGRRVRERRLQEKRRQSLRKKQRKHVTRDEW